MLVQLALFRLSDRRRFVARLSGWRLGFALRLPRGGGFSLLLAMWWGLPPSLPGVLLLALLRVLLSPALLRFFLLPRLAALRFMLLRALLLRVAAGIGIAVFRVWPPRGLLGVRLLLAFLKIRHLLTPTVARTGRWIGGRARTPCRATGAGRARIVHALAGGDQSDIALADGLTPLRMFLAVCWLSFA